jgi:hypothetical protein
MNSSGRWMTLLLIGTTAAAVIFGIRMRAAEHRASVLKESQRRMAESATNMQPATFVRADATGVTYRIPQEVDVGGQTFVNTVEHTTRYGTVFEVFGAVFGDYQVLQTVRSGTPIRVLVRGTGSTAVIEALYVAP